MMLISRHFLLIVLFLFVALELFFYGTALSETKDVRIISQDVSGIQFEFTLPSFEIKDVRCAGEIHRRIIVDGWAYPTEAGHPALPSTGTLLQIPEGTGMVLEILEADFDTISNCRIAPVPTRTMSETETIRSDFIKHDDIYHSEGLLPQAPVTLDRGGIVRGIPVVRLGFQPFQWNPRTRQLRVTKKIIVKVCFDNSAMMVTHQSTSFATVKDPFEALKKDLIINYHPLYENSVADPSPRAALKNVSSATGNALRIEVERDGIYRITYDDLSDAGLDTSTINVATFQLFHGGEEVAIDVKEGEYIEFYGEGIDTEYTCTNVYRLQWGLSSGKRIVEKDGTVSGQAPEITSFHDTLHFEENHVFWAKMPGAFILDYWFWERMQGPCSTVRTLSIPSPLPISDNAAIRVYFQGQSTADPHPNHRTKVLLNGTLIGDETWDWEVAHTQAMTAPQNILVDGNNTITIQSCGNGNDDLYLNWIEVDYLRSLRAEDDELFFPVEGTGSPSQMTITDITGEDSIIYDVTDPHNVKRIVNVTVQPDGGHYRALFESAGTGAESFYLAVSDRIRSPAGIHPWRFSDLKDLSNGADYLIITDEDFVDSVEPLRQLREKRGLRARTVAVTDIFNEFNDGIFDPAAIREFLEYTYTFWQYPAPAYVFLVGDANIDYRDYYQSGKGNFAPVHLGITTGLGLTPDDNWYVCMDGKNDVLPDMCIGRIPGSSAAMVAGIIGKIVAYEESPDLAPSRALFAADNDDTDFEDLNEQLITALPPGFTPEKAYLRVLGNANTATAAIIGAINRGMFLTNYVGHGSLTNWAGEFIFESSDVASLNNGSNLTLVTAFDCINGYFSQSQPSNSFYSLGQEFVLAADRGAIGSFAPSGLGYTWENEIMAQKLFSVLFDEGNNILGSLTTQSKLAAYGAGVSDDAMAIFTLCGDPATFLKWPASFFKIGDIDGNGLVELPDAVMALKVISGISTGCTFNTSTDVNNDGATGTAEVLYILQYLTGLRQ